MSKLHTWYISAWLSGPSFRLMRFTLPLLRRDLDLSDVRDHKRKKHYVGEVSLCLTSAGAAVAIASTTRASIRAGGSFSDKVYHAGFVDHAYLFRLS